MPVLVVISTLDGGRRNEALRLPAPELASKLGLFRSSAVIVPASTLARTRAPSGTLMRPCTRQRSVRRRGSGQRLTIQRTPFSKRCRRLGGRPDQRSSTAAAATSPVAASRSSRPLSKSTTTSLAPGARTRQQAADATRPSRCSAARRSYAVHGSPKASWSSASPARRRSTRSSRRWWPSCAPGRQPRSSPSSPPRSAPASASSTVAASTPSVTDRRRSIGCSASSGSSRWPGRRRRSATWDWPAWPPTPATPTRRTWPGSAAASAVSRHGGCSADGHRQPASVRPVGPRWRLGRAVAFLTYERERHYFSLADRGLAAFVGFGSIFPHTGPIWRNHHMCRLLAYASMAPITPQELVGDDLKSFVSLAEEHGDGWGMAWYEDDGELDVAKDVEAAHASDLLDKLSRTTETRAMVLHLRRASPGLSITLENTHPFTGGRLAFAHNGWIRPIPELEDLLDPEVRHGLRGTTDSERYFRLLLAAMEESGDVERALPPLLERLRGEFHYNALNFVLLTEQHLYAACDYSVEAVMRRGDPEYYTLGYRVSSGSVVVGSSGCWGDRPAWQTLVNHQALLAPARLRHPGAVRCHHRRPALRPGLGLHDQVGGQQHQRGDATVTGAAELHLDAVARGELADHEEPEHLGVRQVHVRRLEQAVVDVGELLVAHADALVLDLEQVGGRQHLARDQRLGVRRREGQGVLQQLRHQADHVGGGVAGHQRRLDR